jgi:hypothetical protein
MRSGERNGKIACETGKGEAFGLLEGFIGKGYFPRHCEERQRSV